MRANLDSEAPIRSAANAGQLLAIGVFRRKVAAVVDAGYGGVNRNVRTSQEGYFVRPLRAVLE